MKDKVKNIVIAVLLIVILAGGYWFWNYQKGVYRALNYSIYSSLNMTQGELLEMGTMLEQYDDRQMSVEELVSVLSESNRYFRYGDYIKKYDNNISMDFAYANYHDLKYYLTSLHDITIATTKEITAEDVEYHKNNLLKIIKLWEPFTFKVTDNYIKPTPQLKKLIEETNNLATEGVNKIIDKQ